MTVADTEHMVSSMNFLTGKRWDPEANILYKVPIAEFNPVITQEIVGEDTTQDIISIDFDTDEAKNIIAALIGHHMTKQVPRLVELERYHSADGNIHRRPPKRDATRADNRIASNFAQFVTAFNSGVVISNPIKYNVPTPNDEDTADVKLDATASKLVEDSIEKFKRTSNESYLNKRLVNEAYKKGRAYDIVYRNEYGEETCKMLPTEETFIVYDDSLDERSICGVRYRRSPSYIGESKMYIDVYALDGLIYHFEQAGVGASSAMMTLVEPGNEYKTNPEDQYFNACQITEYRINDDRTSVFEAVLDTIDAYDLSQSELANYQQDANEAYLVIKGNPLTGLPVKAKPGEKQKSMKETISEVLAAYKEANMIILGDKTTDLEGKPVGAEPDAYYLKREYDSIGAEAYKKRLVADILRFTFVVDFTSEQSLGSNETGIGMRFRGWGNDNQRKTAEQLLDAGFKRRLRLLTASWTLQSWGDESSSTYDDIYEVVNLTTLTFTPNIPRSDTEMAGLVTAMFNVLSDKTVYQLAEELTGVDPSDEEQRVKDQKADNVATFGLGYPTEFGNNTTEETGGTNESGASSAAGSDVE